MASATSATPPVKKLDEIVVNRIAAIEVIQRPANALKELLENSLDAKSTDIQITVEKGGLKLLQVQDNGTGIRKDDLSIVCERFTTSKLTQFEDLETIATFGFRGEALASISRIAHLTIITKTASDHRAYKASYEDTKLIGSPIACVGNQGTQIIVEDLFHNVAIRRRSLRSSSEEHTLIADVVNKFAIHNPTVGFTLRTQGESSTSVWTNPNSTHLDNIRCIYGADVAKGVKLVEAQDESLKFTLKGYISNPNFPMKKETLMIFINDRLVDSQAVRKTLDEIYTLYFPKGMHPFVYLSLRLDRCNVDVNVHGNKHEVYFLPEDVILDKIKTAIEAKLEAHVSEQSNIETTALSLEKAKGHLKLLRKAIIDKDSPSVVIDLLTEVEHHIVILNLEKLEICTKYEVALKRNSILQDQVFALYHENGKLTTDKDKSEIELDNILWPVRLRNLVFHVEETFNLDKVMICHQCGAPIFSHPEQGFCIFDSSTCAYPKHPKEQRIFLRKCRWQYFLCNKDNTFINDDYRVIKLKNNIIAYYNEVMRKPESDRKENEKVLASRGSVKEFFTFFCEEIAKVMHFCNATVKEDQQICIEEDLDQLERFGIPGDDFVKLLINSFALKSTKKPHANTGNFRSITIPSDAPRSNDAQLDIFQSNDSQTVAPQSDTPQSTTNAPHIDAPQSDTPQSTSSVLNPNAKEFVFNF